MPDCRHVGHVVGMNEAERRAVRRALRRLRQRREDADYRPGVTVDASAARQSMHDAAEVFVILKRRQ